MTSTLPVEIWQLILEHALILHPFFATDPVANTTGNRYDIDTEISDWLDPQGWGEELCRPRLTLRLVCHSWKTFVDRPEIKLRFGRMGADIAIIHNTPRTSVAELMQARRIEAPHYDNFRIAKASFMDEIGLAQTILDALEHGDAIFKAEIITHVAATTSSLILELRPGAFPHLKSLHFDLTKDYPIRARWIAGAFAKISTHFPSMVFLYITLDIIRFSSEEVLRLQSLTTLVITSPTYLVQGLAFDKWSLPSLHHLKIGMFQNVELLRSLLGALSHLGGRLKVLDVEVDNVDEDDDMVPRIWSDCPRLESLRFPLTLLLAHPPNHNRHPLRYLVNSEFDPRGSCWCTVIGWLPGDFTSTLISFCNALPNLVVVRDSHDWTSVGFRDLGNSTEGDVNFRIKSDEESYRQMVETAVRIKALNMTVRFEDVNEKTWE